MKNFWIMGFLGLGVIALNFLGFTSGVKAAVLMAIGAAICFISFREIIRRKIVKAVSEESSQPKSLSAAVDENQKPIQQ